MKILESLESFKVNNLTDVKGGIDWSILASGPMSQLTGPGTKLEEGVMWCWDSDVKDTCYLVNYRKCEQ